MPERNIFVNDLRKKVADLPTSVQSIPLELMYGGYPMVCATREGYLPRYAGFVREMYKAGRFIPPVMEIDLVGRTARITNETRGQKPKDSQTELGSRPLHPENFQSRPPSMLTLVREEVWKGDIDMPFLEGLTAVPNPYVLGSPLKQTFQEGHTRTEIVTELSFVLPFDISLDGLFSMSTKSRDMVAKVMYAWMKMSQIVLENGIYYFPNGRHGKFDGGYGIANIGGNKAGGSQDDLHAQFFARLRKNFHPYHLGVNSYLGKCTREDRIIEKDKEKGTEKDRMIDRGIFAVSYVPVTEGGVNKMNIARATTRDHISNLIELFKNPDIANDFIDVTWLTLLRMSALHNSKAFNITLFQDLTSSEGHLVLNIHPGSGDAGSGSSLVPSHYSINKIARHPQLPRFIAASTTTENQATTARLLRATLGGISLEEAVTIIKLNNSMLL